MTTVRLVFQTDDTKSTLCRNKVTDYQEEDDS